MTLYGGKKYIIPKDGIYGDLEDLPDVDGEDDFDEDECVVVEYWVGRHGDEDEIGIETGGFGERLSPEVAKLVAKAIVTCADWPETKAGKKEVARLRKLHDKHEKEWAAKAKAKRRPTDTSREEKEG